MKIHLFNDTFFLFLGKEFTQPAPIKSFLITVWNRTIYMIDFSFINIVCLIYLSGSVLKIKYLVSHGLLELWMDRGEQCCCLLSSVWRRMSVSISGTCTSAHAVSSHSSCHSEWFLIVCKLMNTDRLGDRRTDNTQPVFISETGPSFNLMMGQKTL